MAGERSAYLKLDSVFRALPPLGTSKTSLPGGCFRVTSDLKVQHGGQDELLKPSPRKVVNYQPQTM